MTGPVHRLRSGSSISIEAADMPDSDRNGVAVVTGASSGVGRAIARRLALDGLHVIAVGRDIDRLATLEAEARTDGCVVEPLSIDLARDEELRSAATRLVDGGPVAVLVHAAGAYEAGAIETQDGAAVEAQLAVNLRAPIALTGALLPRLRAAGGTIVFINSTSGRRPSGGASVYAASKHGLRGFADSLRDEVNADGVRVISLFLGRTATPLQRRLADETGRPYEPEKMIDPEAVASLVSDLRRLHPSAEVTDVVIRPMRKP
jgi:short-subunit dehydrogenase